MAKNPNQEYSEAALQRQIDVALANLPATARDEQADWETRCESALEQLFHTLRIYAGSDRVKTGYPENMPRAEILKDQIIAYIEFEWSLPPRGHRALIDSYLERAIGKKT